MRNCGIKLSSFCLRETRDIRELICTKCCPVGFHTPRLRVAGDRTAKYPTKRLLIPPSRRRLVRLFRAINVNELNGRDWDL